MGFGAIGGLRLGRRAYFGGNKSRPADLVFHIGVYNRNSEPNSDKMRTLFVFGQ